MKNFKHYKKAFFVFDGISIKPDQKSLILNKYIENNKIKSFLIITAFDSNIKKINYNRKRNILLKNDLFDFDYLDCYGCDNIENPTHLEESFFVKNISLSKSIELCLKYQQDCILWSDNDIPRLYDQNGNII